MHPAQALAEHEKKGRIEPHIRGGAFLQWDFSVGELIE
jgi:hypothetical protein